MSLISTYQGRKTLFANKLIDKGVDASNTDGLTTLINKIDDIHTSNDITLYGNKKILQTSDNAELYTLILKDGMCSQTTSSQLITYEEHTYSTDTVVNLNVGSEWTIKIEGSLNFWLSQNGADIRSGDYILSLWSDYLIGYGNGDYVVNPTQLGTSGIFKLKDGVLKQGNTTLDLSSYNFTLSNIYKVFGSGTIKIMKPNGTANGDVVYFYKKVES